MVKYSNLHDYNAACIDPKLFSGSAAASGIQQTRAPTQQASPTKPWGGRRREGQKGRRYYVLLSDDLKFCLPKDGIRISCHAAHAGIQIIDLVDACIKVTRPRPVPVSL